MKRSINLSKLEMVVMKPFWERGELSVREAATHLADEEGAPDYSTVQTIAGRLEKKGGLKRVRKSGNAWVFAAAVERKQIVGRLIDDIVNLLSGSSNPIMTYLVESEKISLEDLRELEALAASRVEREAEEGRDG